MKRVSILLFSLTLILSACSMPDANITPTTSPPSDKPYCGDGVCDGPETAKNCPEDCPAVDTSKFVDIPEEGVYWVENPTSGAMLYLKVNTPVESDGALLPALVLVPGGAGDHSDFTGPGKSAQEIADGGFIVVTFDPDGRSNSTGEEDLNGHIQQDGLAEVIRYTATLPGVDPAHVGLVSFSYGVTMASGALVRHPDLEVVFFIDWEGPANRFYTTHDCSSDHPGIGSTTGMAPCDDDIFWGEREAETFIAQITIPYQRLQFEEDHSQEEPIHALVMINAAVAGTSPWVRLNNYPPNQTFDLESPPPMFPGRAGTGLNAMVIKFAQELFGL